MADGRERIAAAFAVARAEGRAALMPYMMGGFPTAEIADAVAHAYAAGGADLIELGVAYSDPLADGPVIHDAATKALAGGATLERTLETCASVSDSVPVVLMTYVNMILAATPRRFAARLAAAGAAGAIVPDLPREESDEIGNALSEEGLALVPLIAPTTPPERRAMICESAQGFVYAVSTTGVTGEREAVPAHLSEMVAGAREAAPVPVAVGFGIGTPGAAAAVGEIADGVIIGSRLVRVVGEATGEAEAAAAVTGFLEACRAEMSRAAASR